MSNTVYTPGNPRNEKLNPYALRECAIQQITQAIGESDMRHLRVIVRGNNFNNVRMWVEGPDEILSRLPDPIFYRDWEVEYKKVVKASAARRQWRPLWVVPFLIIALALVVKLREKDMVPFSLESVSERVEIANKNVEYWTVTQSYLKFTEVQKNEVKMQSGFSGFKPKCANQPKAQFVITLKDLYRDKALIFKSQKYIVDTDLDPTQFKAEEVCKFVNRHFDDERKEVIEAIKRFSPKLSLKIKIAELQLPIEEVIGELGYIIAKVAFGYDSCAEILIKGYADGQDSIWTGIQDNAYEYTKIPRYSLAHPGSSDHFSFIHTDEEISVPLEYGNSHLPDLRAMYVNEVFIKPIINQCSSSNNVSSHILEGREFLEKDELKRSVQIYVIFF